ncbi:MAG: hypothetical protein HPY55_00970 [Firmicutes bacterium]|nr:hypothetical protein [Bacillota bacterium]
MDRSRNLNRWLRLDVVRVLALGVAWVGSVVLHNLISGLLHVEEPVFFTIAVIVIPAYAIVAVVYTLAFLVMRSRR